MLMSKSRLEKFLYALYSLDSSDLPTPLSRIEELYKCLVTGEEAPIFKPLSRVEKYLMAILGAYDVDSLPNPLSRVEVLLYKLATGDDSLEDFDTFLSEHEELLAGIIGNGGVGGNIDIEYVLHTLSTEFNTLYNTAEKPVKSAILKGQTLVNLDKNTYPITQWGTNENNNYFVDVVTLASGMIKPSTKYLFKIYGLSCDYDIVCLEGISSLFSRVTSTGYLFNKNGSLILQSSDSIQTRTSYTPHFTRNDIKNLTEQDKQNFKMIILEYQQGMENWDIPYFEGMKSVQMPVLTTTGKNLFDISKEQKNITININNGDVDFKTNDRNTSDFIKVIPNTIYKCNVTMTRLAYYDKNKQFISLETSVSQPITIPTSCNFVKFSYDNTLTNIQFEQGSIATSYEPYKSNILTTNEEVELRGIGDVKDELNLLTGELTQRIGEVVLDGSENWNVQILTYNARGTLIGFPNTLSWANSSISNNFLWNDVNVGDKSGQRFNGGTLLLSIPLTSLTSNDAEGFKEWLNNNNTIIQYKYSTESVKTIDISTVNQDGNSTKLKTFDDITYVALSSEGLIPEVELEVATKNEEDLEDSSVYTTHTLSEEFNTLYNTAEKPVKSAILKGQTSTGKNLYMGRDTSNTDHEWASYPITLEPNTYVMSNNGGLRVSTVINYETGDTIVTDSTFTITTQRTVLLCGSAANRDKFQLEVGKEPTDYESYRLVSVKMPVLTTVGKNQWIEQDFTKHNSNSSILTNTNNGFIVEHPNQISEFIKTYINLKKGTWTISFDVEKTDTSDAWVFLQKGNVYGENITKNVRIQNGRCSITYTSSSDIENACFFFDLRHQGMVTISNIQLEESSTANPYEPHKSNILTCNEPIELRGIGDAKDELNLLTGEVVERIGEIVYTGDEKWKSVVMDSIPDNISFYLPLNNQLNDTTNGTMRGTIKDNLGFTINCFSATVSDPRLNGKKGFSIHSNGNVYFTIPTSECADVKTWKNKLKEQPLVLQYAINPIVKTVDLSVVDQDGDNTKLSTFDDITHVTLSSEGLIPEAELEVAEKVPEVAASMLTISREQEVINATANEQSENVDATMIATTEIYEGLL